jgi:quinol monooxygenase YgiN
MSVPVLIGFAGVLVAAVATGVLAGRCARRPRPDFALWAAATLGLTVALAAQSIGFASGFGPVTFRAVQLFALVLVPLWLAWGLVELVARSESARFAMRLACTALTVVAGVILATDPLSGQPFGKSWPLASRHYQPVSHYVLDLVQALAVITAVAAAGVAAARARHDRRWLTGLTGIAAVGVALLLTAGLRFSLPARSAYPLLGTLAAALVWFGVTRLQDLPPGGRDRDRDHDRIPVPDRGDGGGPEQYRLDSRWPDDDDGSHAEIGAAGRYPAGGAYRGGSHARGVPHGTNGHSRPRDPRQVRAADEPYELAGADGPGWPGGPDGPGGLVRAGEPGAPPDSGPLDPAAGSRAAAPARPYGRIVIFTLLDDRAADFDRLSEQTAEQVRTGEPDTLVYVIHLVPNAPMQRIFYEIYRDRAAFDSHESQPYVQRFVTERRSCVLATNVIELRLKYAKVAPLPSPQPPGSAQPPSTTQPPRQSPAPRALPPPGQAASWPLDQVQTLEPLPPAPGPRLPSATRRPDGG